ncbi:MAG: CDP-alcohol phosphatidyltransferase family protein [Kiloniellaceae bacterium]
MSGTRRRRLPGLTVNRLIPNGLTLLGLCAGLTATRLALMDRWELAIAAIGVAMVMDALDGRIARLMGATSEFGAQLDSLADVINFGVAPALIVYLWALGDAGGLGWALALVFVLSCALRLARFNTGLGVGDPLPWTDRFFTGVPAPAGAGLALLPMVLSFELGDGVLSSAWFNGAMLIAVAALMVSKIPTFSAKRLKVPHTYVGLALIGVGAFAAFLVSTPWVTLSLVGLAYLASIPFSVAAFRRLQTQAPDDHDVDRDSTG